MKSFDDWYIQDNVENPSLVDAFEAGQQSKQAEVDELRKRIGEVIYDLQHIESAMWEEQIDHVLFVLKGEPK